MNYLNYKGYIGRVAYEEDEKVYYGQVVGIKDVITFQGDTRAEAVKAFYDSVDEYIAFCKEQGVEPEAPEGDDASVLTLLSLEERVRELIHTDGRSLSQIAEAAGLSRATVYRVMNESGPISLNILTRLCLALGYGLSLVKIKGRQAEALAHELVTRPGAKT
jgi:predicted HicB family RNase H-like nuclease